MPFGLPFPLRATLKSRPNTTVAELVPFAVWPARARAGANGVIFDHEAEAPLSYAAEFEVANRFIECEGESYVVVSCERNTFLPHLGLRLRRVEGSANG